MDNDDRKLDELVGIVKGNTVAIEKLTTTVTGLVDTVKQNTSAIGELRVMAKDNASAIDDLAVTVKEGFDHVGEDINVLKADVKDIKKSMVHDFQHNALEQRVESLELKIKPAN